MPGLDECRADLIGVLAARTEPARPLPQAGSSPFEAIAAVALELVAEPRAARLAFEALREGSLLVPEALASADPLELDDLFKQARVRLAARSLRPLQKIARWAADTGFDAEAASTRSTEDLRDAWLRLNGVGPATVDALLLFGLGRPTYPVDRATYRILVRHGWLEPTADYDEARSVAASLAADDPATLASISLGFERLGREACKPSAPRCDRCPLRPYLPSNGPIEPE